MCGICGEVLFDRAGRASRERLEAMCQTITHRGPDSQGVYIDGQAGLGSTRLSIIDVAGGRMPLSNEDGSVWIAYNGEIYNFAHLRERLKSAGHRFATSSDTETIVHLYEQDGDDFVRSLNGMFAAAIWDGRRRRLVLARDQLGIKPLYYAQLGDRLLFGSEIATLLAAGINTAIDPVALHDYLSLNYVPGPRTIFAAVRKLLPGHMLTLDADSGAIQIRRYWEAPLPEPLRVRGRSVAELEVELLDLLRTVVRDQMVSDVPLGAFLSGGIDSSLIVALMSEAATSPVRTFSVGFKERSYNELPYARIIAERFRTDHHELILDPQAEDLVSTVARVYDEPFADSSAAAVYAVSGLAARHVKVALSGDGGDELFGGYYTYQADYIATWFRRLPQPINTRLLPGLVNLFPSSEGKVSLDFKLKRFMAGGALPPLPAHYAWKAFLSEEMKAKLYAGGLHAGTPLRPSVEALQAYYDGYDTPDLLNRLMHVDLKVQLPDGMLTKVDRASMAHSLEVRVPLLDMRLAEFMIRMPSDLKMRGLTLKYLLKRVAARVLPQEILKRPKAGFNVPIARWVKGDLRPLIEERLSPRALADQGFFNPQVVAEMVAAHQSGRQDHSRSIWNLLVFSLWYERHARGAVQLAAETRAAA